MKKIIILFISVLFLTSCEKPTDKMVKYIATDATAEYSITYRNAYGEIISENIAAQSREDQWTHSFAAEEGQILYLSGIYGDITSSLKLMIMIDGKIYKQAQSIGDTVRYLVVSGTVPY
ncbi:MAG: hypothetical protein ACOCX8_00015 [Bacteroidota bacterium]